MGVFDKLFKRQKSFYNESMVAEIKEMKLSHGLWYGTLGGLLLYLPFEKERQQKTGKYIYEYYLPNQEESIRRMKRKALFDDILKVKNE